MCVAWGLAERRGLTAFVPSVSPLFRMQGVYLSLESGLRSLRHGLPGVGLMASHQASVQCPEWTMLAPEINAIASRGIP